MKKMRFATFGMITCTIGVALLSASKIHRCPKSSPSQNTKVWICAAGMLQEEPARNGWSMLEKVLHNGTVNNAICFPCRIVFSCAVAVVVASGCVVTSRRCTKSAAGGDRAASVA